MLENGAHLLVIDSRLESSLYMLQESLFLLPLLSFEINAAFLAIAFACSERDALL